MKNTERFEFKVANGMDTPAIWFKLHGREVTIHPFNLYDILCDCYRERFFCKGVKSRFQIFEYEVCGSFQDENLGYYHIDFQRESFIESAQQSLKALCEAVIHGNETIYEDVNSLSAEKLLLCLEKILVPKSYYQISRDEIEVENFSFHFVEPYSCDTHFIIKIGELDYDAYLSDWSTDFNRLRLDIESVVLHRGTQIELYFEDSPTIIMLKRRTIYDSDYSVTNNNVVKVTIIPNDFIKEPKIYGWCEPRQLIRSLYLGLLNLCIVESNCFDNDPHVRDWGEFRLATYNKLQSCVIEDFIMGVKEDDFTYRPRQRVINSAEDMLIDYKNLQKTLSL